MTALQVLILILALSRAATAADLFDLPKPEPVMNKLYSSKKDLSVTVGYFPMNAFSKYFTLGAAYSQFFNDSHGWEVINAQYAIEQPAGLKSDLLNPSSGYQNVTTGVPRAIVAEDFATLQYSISTSYIYSPFYMKSLFFNSSQVHMRLMMLLGAGLSQFQITTVPSINAAVIQKFIMPKGDSLSFEVRYFSYITANETVRSNFAMNFGYVWSWGK